MKPPDARRPWYREIWPWLLMLPPLFAVAGGVTMIWLATHTPAPLVVADYARIEELTAARYAQDETAVELGLEASLALNLELDRIELRLRAPAEFVRPAALLLRLRHATRRAADRELRLVRYGEDYAAPLGGIVPGRYAAEILPEDFSWRLGAAAARLQGEIPLTAQVAGR
jgi:hypothetical protein